MSRNNGDRDNILIREGLGELERRLPPRWHIGKPRVSAGPIDAIAKLSAPDKRAASLAVEARWRLEPKAVLPLAEAARNANLPGPLVVFAPYLSDATRQRLRERDIGYLDLTGNIRIVVPEPGLFIETQGASEAPDRADRPARSLKGPKAGRIVHALVDHERPPGVRQLAAMTKLDPGYVSRVLAFLDSEALVTRVGRGRLESVDWPALLRRWARDAPLESRGRVGKYLEPRGITSLLARLRDSEDRYAITGALAAAPFAPAAPARLATLWTRDAPGAASRLSLRPAETGANVLLVEPYDDVVFQGATMRDFVWHAAPSQVAADLLTSPGRGPSEAEELIEWMRKNEGSWRR